MARFRRSFRSRGRARFSRGRGRRRSSFRARRRGGISRRVKIGFRM